VKTIEMKRIYIIMLSLAVIVAVCLFWFRTGHNTNPNDELSFSERLVIQMITTDIHGTVVDENFHPVSDSKIFAGEKTATTDMQGVFYIQNATVNQNAAVVRAEKEGYFNGIRTLIASQESVNQVEIQLNPKKIAGSFHSVSGGTVSFADTKIDFPADAIVTDNKQKYTGTVNVAAYYLDPAAENFELFMPGDLRAIDAAGNLCGLQSFGMFVVELTGSGGEKLQLNGTAPAIVESLIPACLRNYAPAAIPLWHFDETQGLWMEEGSAVMQRQSYKGAVTHFSYWNFDVPMLLTRIKMRFVDQYDRPITGARATLHADGIFGFGNLFVDDNGVIFQQIPKDQIFTLNLITSLCSEIIYSTQIGPFTADTDLGTIRINIDENRKVIFTGKVLNCEGFPVTNGYLSARLDGRQMNVELTGGTFSLAFLRCSSEPAKAIITITDRNTLQSVRKKLSVESGTVDLGMIKACGEKIKTMMTLNFKGKEYQYFENDVRFYSTGRWTHFSFLTVSRKEPVNFGLIPKHNGEVKIGENLVYIDVSAFEKGIGVFWRSAEGILNVEKMEYINDHPKVTIPDKAIGYIKGTYTATVKKERTSEETEVYGTIDVTIDRSIFDNLSQTGAYVIEVRRKGDEKE